MNCYIPVANLQSSLGHQIFYFSLRDIGYLKIYVCNINCYSINYIEY